MRLPATTSHAPSQPHSQSRQHNGKRNSEKNWGTLLRRISPNFFCSFRKSLYALHNSSPMALKLFRKNFGAEKQRGFLFRGAEKQRDLLFHEAEKQYPIASIRACVSVFREGIFRGVPSMIERYFWLLFYFPIIEHSSNVHVHYPIGHLVFNPLDVLFAARPLFVKILEPGVIVGDKILLGIQSRVEIILWMNCFSIDRTSSSEFVLDLIDKVGLNVLGPMSIVMRDYRSLVLGEIFTEISSMRKHMEARKILLLLLCLDLSFLTVIAVGPPTCLADVLDNMCVVARAMFMLNGRSSIVVNEYTSSVAVLGNFYSSNSPFKTVVLIFLDELYDARPWFVIILQPSVPCSVEDLMKPGVEVFGVDRMAFKDVISWTAMIGFLVRYNYPNEALDIFSQMRSYGIQPDEVTILNLLSVYTLLGDLVKGRLLHNFTIICGFWSELSIMNSLITMYSKRGDLNSAVTSFNRIANKSLVSWTTIISGHVQNGKPRAAIQFLTRMRLQQRFNLDSVILVSSIAACAELANLELCSQFHGYVFTAGFLSHNSVQNNLLTSYAKCEDMEQAYKVFNEMAHQDIVSWNSIIYGCGINGDGKAAIALFHEMERCGEEPDCISYLSILHACSHLGLVDDGLAIFYQMAEDKKIRAFGEHYGCVVDMLARAGRLEEAREFAVAVAEEVGPHVWKALLGGSRVHDNVKLAQIAGRKVLELDHGDAGNLVLFSNVCKSIGRFKDAESLRLKMKMKGLMKKQGFNLLDVVTHDSS